jgi:hypothetical protein
MQSDSLLCLLSSGRPANLQRQREIGVCLGVACALLSFGLHGLAVLGLEFRIWNQIDVKQIVLVDVLLAPSISSPKSVRKSPRSATPTAPAVSRPAPDKPLATRKKAAAHPSSPRKSGIAAEALSRVNSEVLAEVDAKSIVPALPLLGTNATPTVLANESGQDSLKHGSEARFMHGVATEEFVEENYIGEYSLGSSGRVWIVNGHPYSAKPWAP